ncbi:MAG TPA: alpha-L-arabinofuranosidase C-terminal domain-containing protein [Bacteroidales bacterium]|nr:alpha-L-arabinofuranosidase C-terminal domain-containing protein [Bacteroidales bacterium]
MKTIKSSFMKKLPFLLGCMILSCLFPDTLKSQDKAVIKIDFDRKIGTVDPNIYGAFVEPIMKVVYGNIYDPASPFADENGFRKDFIQLVRELKIPVVRWPGGNYVSGYNWEDGIGPKDKRPARLDLAWHQVESNHMGTDEYVQLCKLIGAENFICINGGTGTLDQARHWVEYCNLEKGTYYSDLRREYGNEEPFKVKYWALGNEIDGPWQMGQKSAEDYVKFALEAGKLMQLVDKDIKLIASGASNYRPDNGWIDWNDYVLTHMTGTIDYLSVHRYATEALGDDSSFSGMMSLGLDLDQKIEAIKALIIKAMTKTGSTRPVYISFDEWASGFGNNITVSLMVAQHLNSFIRHADIVRMANMTMLSNLVGQSPEGVYKNATFRAFWLYSNNCFGTSLDVSTSCEEYSNKIFSEIPYLDVTAVLNSEAGNVVINVVNRHETKAIETDIILQTGNYAGNAKVNEVNGKITDPGNSRAEEAVNSTSSEIRFKGNIIKYSFPAHSFTQIMIPFK